MGVLVKVDAAEGELAEGFLFLELCCSSASSVERVACGIWGEERDRLGCEEVDWGWAYRQPHWHRSLRQP
jgi:hypothetical protein